MIELLRADTGLAAALEHIAAVVAAPLDTTLRTIAPLPADRHRSRADVRRRGPG